MKKLIIAVVIGALLILTACSTEGSNFDNEINNLREQTELFATGGGDVGEFTKIIEDFNAKLDEIQTKDESMREYIELQRKANDLRLEGFKEMNHDKINESTGYQAEALQIYNGIKKGAN